MDGFKNEDLLLFYNALQLFTYNQRVVNEHASSRRSVIPSALALYSQVFGIFTARSNNKISAYTPFNVIFPYTLVTIGRQQLFPCIALTGFSKGTTMCRLQGRKCTFI